jgi:hypothetical protein
VIGRIHVIDSGVLEDLVHAGERSICGRFGGWEQAFAIRITADRRLGERRGREAADGRR